MAQVMKPMVVALLMSAAAGVGLPGQIAPRTRDESIAIARQQRAYLDSLAVGRQRWAHAAIVEYRLQSHIECFCFPDADDDTGFVRGLLTIRDGRIIDSAVGAIRNVVWRRWTVDSLFAVVEKDLTDWGRSAMHLELHPEFGFPMLYIGETREIADVEITIRVDSFAVTQRRHPGEERGIPGARPTLVKPARSAGRLVKQPADPSFSQMARPRGAPSRFPEPPR